MTINLSLRAAKTLNFDTHRSDLLFFFFLARPRLYLSLLNHSINSFNLVPLIGRGARWHCVIVKSRERSVQWVSRHGTARSPTRKSSWVMCIPMRALLPSSHLPPSASFSHTVAAVQLFSASVCVTCSRREQVISSSLLFSMRLFVLCAVFVTTQLAQRCPVLLLSDCT